MARHISAGRYTDYVIALLDCGCRVTASATNLFDDSPTLECVWEHGPRKWVRFGPPEECYYRWKCKRRGCKQKERRYDSFLMCLSAARSHARIHGHNVDVYCDTWLGLEIAPDTLDGEAPF